MNGRRTLLLPRGVTGIAARVRATKLMAASQWTPAATSDPAPVALPAGTGFWVGDGMVMVTELSGNQLHMAVTTGNYGSCASGSLTAGIWIGRQDYFDTSKLHKQRYQIDFTDPTMTLTGTRIEQWSLTSQAAADQALMSLNEYADPSGSLIAWCHFQGRRWQ